MGWLSIPSHADLLSQGFCEFVGNLLPLVSVAHQLLNFVLCHDLPFSRFQWEANSSQWVSCPTCVMSGLRFDSVPYDDRLFRHEATIGYKWSCEIAQRLNDHGVACHAPPLEFAATVEDRQRFINEQDVILEVVGGCVEVKSRRLSFTDQPESFPYPTAFVDTCTGWDLKTPKPRAIVIVSQITGDALVIPGSTQSEWTVSASFDRVRRIHERWYCVERASLRPFKELADWLLQRQEVLRRSGLF